MLKQGALFMMVLIALSSFATVEQVYAGSELVQALQAGRLPRSADLIQSGANLNVSHDDITPLHISVACGYEETVRLLLLVGADPNIRAGDQSTPLFLDTPSSSPVIIDLLLQAGADANARDVDQRTPMHHAYTTRTAELLIAYGADVNARDRYGNTPLHCAQTAPAERASVTRLLLAHKADVDARDNQGRTALHLALTGGTDADVLTLLVAGADVNAIDDQGFSPLLLASWLKRPQLIELLVQHGGNASQCSSDISTALHLLARGSEPAHERVVEALLEAGANVNARDNQGFSPLFYAHSEGSCTIQELLLNHGARLNLWERALLCAEVTGALLGLISGLGVYGLANWFVTGNRRVANALGGIVLIVVSAVLIAFLTNPYVGEIHGGIRVMLTGLWLLPPLIALVVRRLLASQNSPSPLLGIYLKIGLASLLALLVIQPARQIVPLPWRIAYEMEGYFLRSLAVTLLTVELGAPLYQRWRFKGTIR